MRPPAVCGAGAPAVPPLFQYCVSLGFRSPRRLRHAIGDQMSSGHRSAVGRLGSRPDIVALCRISENASSSPHQCPKAFAFVSLPQEDMHPGNSTSHGFLGDLLDLLACCLRRCLATSSIRLLCLFVKPTQISLPKYRNDAREDASVLRLYESKEYRSDRWPDFPASRRSVSTV